MSSRSPLVARTDRLSAVWMMVVVGALALAVYLLFRLADGEGPVPFTVACVALAILLAVMAFGLLNPDRLRSQYTEETLSLASDMLEDIKGGLSAESAEAICRHLMPETHASTIAVTDETHVLACVGDMVEDFPPGSLIHTPATRYVIEHGIVQSFTQAIEVKGERGRKRQIPAGIIAPLKVRDHTVGALKFYFKNTHEVNRTQYALVAGFSELISTQLAIHELELQEELTARAEVRALQAQINPHFLFNTLNTIASFTRTDPARARELLREFSSFYRSTLDNSGSLIPVTREIQQTKRYLTFEQARFGDDRIEATFTVEDDVKDAPVPAFIIQPLVENAVRHAMRDEGALHISVSVRAAGENALTIEVEDDGVGMDKATATRLFSESARVANVSAPQGGGAGVAMHNISERIKRFYGPNSFAHVDSRPGSGTVITLHLDLLGSIFVDG
ncbi:histidine kinase [uncultured Enorma sp.]|jgi:two-component system sensor histidine kinase LytS|uniref:histidine kinase n=1 Tax=uncultured Enorma sp. TaxID=1714346 RepID=UPI0025FD1522|nr:histidine kinase [uncultured Enorma sp.]